ncbi:unnamed protein product [Calicophoron daubneyi]
MEEDPNWYKARIGSSEGMVPANYITLYPHSWYVPKCSRREAEARLLEVDPQTHADVQPQGAFILRQSENDLGQFSISVKEGSSVLHFRVFSEPNGKYFIWNNKFQSVNELIDYHRHQTIYGVKALLLRDCVPSKTFGSVGAGPNAIFSDPRPQISSNTTGPHDSGPSNAVALDTGTAKDSMFPPGITQSRLAGRYCVAKFDFSAEFEGEMSFRRGDRVRILGEEDENWWYAELVRSQNDPHQTIRGLIPANYVEVLPQHSSSHGSTRPSRMTSNQQPQMKSARAV